MKKIILFVVFMATLLVGFVVSKAQPLAEGNPTCSGFGYNRNLKLESPITVGTYPIQGLGSLYVDFSNNYTLNWSTQSPAPFIKAVILKGGNNATIKHYDPSVWADMGITTPLNHGGNPPDISHVEFCYNLTTTSAPVIISGRVIDSYGRGIYNARVSTTGNDGQMVTTSTNSFGYYELTGNLTAGNDYLVQVFHKRYRFQAQLVNAIGDVTDFNFSALN